jgi:PilZ domain
MRHTNAMESTSALLSAHDPHEVTDADRRRASRRGVLASCWLIHNEAMLTAKLSDISATGAYLLTPHHLPLETEIVLRHPAAGQLAARIARHDAHGVGVAFVLSEASVGFALRVVASDMTHAPANRAH